MPTVVGRRRDRSPSDSGCAWVGYCDQLECADSSGQIRGVSDVGFKNLIRIDRCLRQIEARQSYIRSPGVEIVT